MKIYIVIPGYNEAKTVGTLVYNCRKKGLDVIFIDDGSKDNSGYIAKKYGAEVIKNRFRMGKGKSLRKGFRLAVRNNCDGVVTLDADGQHDINDVHKIIDLAEKKNPCLIIGNRMNNAKGMPFIRYITNKFMSFIISLACKQKIYDSQCGYRFISKDILVNTKLVSNSFEIETEIIMKAVKKGYPVYSCDIRSIYRDEESKINPIRDTIKFILYFTKELFSSDNV